jgi:hypothetical protein
VPRLEDVNRFLSPITGFKAKPVGYRWPTKFNYLLTSSSRLA